MEVRTSFHSCPRRVVRNLRATLTRRSTTYMSGNLLYLLRLFMDVFINVSYLPFCQWNDQNFWHKWIWSCRYQWRTGRAHRSQRFRRFCHIFSSERYHRPAGSFWKLNIKIDQCHNLIIGDRIKIKQTLFQIPQAFPTIKLGFGPGMPWSEK